MKPSILYVARTEAWNHRAIGYARYSQEIIRALSEEFAIHVALIEPGTFRSRQTTPTIKESSDPPPFIAGRLTSSRTIVCPAWHPEMVRALLLGKPWNVARYAGAMASIADLAHAMAAKVIFCHSTHLSTVALGAVNIPVVAGMMELTSEKTLWRARHSKRFPVRLLMDLEGKRFREVEKRVARDAAVAFVAQESDRADLERWVPGSGVRIVPMGIDTEYFSPDWERRELDTVTFLGAVNAGSGNELWAWRLATTILDGIHQVRPNTRLLILGGGNPSERMKRVASERPEIELVGWVEDHRSQLARSSLLVSPVEYCRGMKTAVLEAMAMGIPVLGTKYTFVGHDVSECGGLVAETDQEFAEQVVTSLSDTGSLMARGRQARAYIEARLGWSRIAELYRKAVRDAC